MCEPVLILLDFSDRFDLYVKGTDLWQIVDKFYLYVKGLISDRLLTDFIYIYVKGLLTFMWHLAPLSSNIIIHYHLVKGMVRTQPDIMFSLFSSE